MNANVLRHLVPHTTTQPDREVLRWVPSSEPAEEGKIGTPLPHESICWAELMQRVEYASRGLAERGFQKGDRALLFIPMSVDLYVAMFAVFRLGGIAVFLDAFARQTQLEACAQLVQPKAFFGSPEAHILRAFLPNSIGSIPLQIVSGGASAGAVSFAELESSNGTIPPIAEVRAEDTALVTFTTGSSGTPKGANRTHGFLTAQHAALSAELPFDKNESDMPAFPIFLLHNIACGLTTVIPAVNFSQPSASDAHRVLRQILHESLQTASMSPALLEALCKLALSEGQTLPLRRLFTGGAPVGPELARLVQEAAPQSELLIFYGSTEAEPIAHISGQEMLHWMTSEANFSSEEGVCVGHLSELIQLALIPIQKTPVVLGENRLLDRQVQRGEVGEVVVAGNHVCTGYYHNPQAFLENKIEEQGCIWHRTGDLGRIDEKGRLWLVGRVHNAIQREGVLLFPVEPEQILKSTPGIAQAAYVGLPDDTLGESAWVVYTTENNAQPDPQALKRTLESAGFPVDRIQSTGKIPMDPRHNSKVDYPALREILGA